VTEDVQAELFHSIAKHAQPQPKEKSEGILYNLFTGDWCGSFDTSYDDSNQNQTG